MWLLTTIILLNAWADNNGVILYYRLNVFGTVINLLDGLMLIGLVAAFSPFGGSGRYRVDRAHPLVAWILILLVIGGTGATMLAIFDNVSLRTLNLSIRNYITLPICFLMGWQLLQRPRQMGWVVFIAVLGSFGSAILAMRATGAVADDLAWGGSLNATRNVSIGGDFGVIAASVAIFATVSRIRVGFALLRLAMMMACVGAIVLVPHRGVWVMAGITTGAAALWLPLVPIRRRLLAVLLGLVVVIITAISTASIYSAASHRDFTQFLVDRLQSLMPGSGGSGQVKAWDSRLPGTVRELELWASEPLFGQGFGYADKDEISHPGMSYAHNTWTSFLAQSGVFGFASVCLMVGSLIVLGRRLSRDGLDRSTILMGVIGASAGVYYLMNGLVSMSFNTQRPATSLALLCGLVIRARAIQLTESRIWAGYIEPGQQISEDLVHNGDHNEARRPHAFA